MPRCDCCLENFEYDEMAILEAEHGICSECYETLSNTRELVEAFVLSNKKAFKGYSQEDELATLQECLESNQDDFIAFLKEYTEIMYEGDIDIWI